MAQSWLRDMTQDGRETDQPSFGCCWLTSIWRGGGSVEFLASFSRTSNTEEGATSESMALAGRLVPGCRFSPDPKHPETHGLRTGRYPTRIRFWKKNCQTKNKGTVRSRQPPRLGRRSVGVVGARTRLNRAECRTRTLDDDGGDGARGREDRQRVVCGVWCVSFAACRIAAAHAHAGRYICTFSLSIPLSMN